VKPPRRSGLPPGTRARLNVNTTLFADGSIVIGGSPTRLVRLGPKASSLLSSESLEVRTGPIGRLVDQLLDIGLIDVDTSSVPPVPLDELTVVVPVFERAEQLDRLLRGLSGVWTIVVDDASANAIAIADVASRHGAELVRLSTNSGPAAARNRGLSRAQTRFVAF